MKTTHFAGALALLTLALFSAAQARGGDAFIQETRLNLEADSSSTELKRGNAGVFLAEIDLGLSILGSRTADPLKKKLLRNLTQEARTFKNARDGAYAASLLKLLDEYDALIDGGHFWTLGVELLAARVATRSFR